MPLKIICLEEHVIDPAIGEAVKPVLARSAPYTADIGASFQETPEALPQDRPRSQAPARAEALASAPIAERLGAMDEHGIDVQVLSSTQPIQALPAGEAADLARRANDRLADAVARHPGRFAGFSILPWQDADAACRELERSVGDLGLTATLLAGHPGEESLIDDPAYAPILATCEALQVPLYIHPGAPLPAVQRPYYAGFSKEVTARLSLYGWGWHHEAGIQVVRLILSGALDRHRSLRLISGHWGEMVPFYLQRMDDTMPPAATGLERTIGQTYRDQVFVTPSGMLNLPHFHFVRETLGAERILFSVDYPYLTMTGARAWLEALPVDEDERAAIAHGNAERLLRLKA